MPWGQLPYDIGHLYTHTDSAVCIERCWKVKPCDFNAALLNCRCFDWEEREIRHNKSLVFGRRPYNRACVHQTSIRPLEWPMFTSDQRLYNVQHTLSEHRIHEKIPFQVTAGLAKNASWCMKPQNRIASFGAIRRCVHCHYSSVFCLFVVLQMKADGVPSKI